MGCGCGSSCNCTGGAQSCSCGDKCDCKGCGVCDIPTMFQVQRLTWLSNFRSKSFLHDSDPECVPQHSLSFKADDEYGDDLMKSKSMECLSVEIETKYRLHFSNQKNYSQYFL